MFYDFSKNGYKNHLADAHFGYDITHIAILRILLQFF